VKSPNENLRVQRNSKKGNRKEGSEIRESAVEKANKGWKRKLYIGSLFE